MFLLFYSKTFSALLIVSLWTAWSFVCAKCQLNQSLEQQIIENPNRAVSNEFTRDLHSGTGFYTVVHTSLNGNCENNVYNMYNESINSSECNVYDQYDEYNQYEQYRHRYAEFPW